MTACGPLPGVCGAAVPLEPCFERVVHVQLTAAATVRSCLKRSGLKKPSRVQIDDQGFKPALAAAISIDPVMNYALQELQTGSPAAGDFLRQMARQRTALFLARRHPSSDIAWRKILEKTQFNAFMGADRILAETRMDFENKSQPTQVAGLVDQELGSIV